MPSEFYEYSQQSNMFIIVYAQTQHQSRSQLSLAFASSHVLHANGRNCHLNFESVFRIYFTTTKFVRKKIAIECRWNMKCDQFLHLVQTAFVMHAIILVMWHNLIVFQRIERM